MQLQLQQLRDDAESKCLRAVAAGDRDSADAWERIGIAIDECQERIASDQAIVNARRGLLNAEVK